MSERDDNRMAAGCLLLVGIEALVTAASVVAATLAHPAVGVTAWLAGNGLWLMLTATDIARSNP